MAQQRPIAKNPAWMFASFCRDAAQAGTAKEVDLVVDIFFEGIVDFQFHQDCVEGRETLADRIEERKFHGRRHPQTPGRTIDRQRARWEPKSYETDDERLTSWERSAKRCLRAKQAFTADLIEANELLNAWTETVRVEQEVDLAFETIFSEPEPEPDTLFAGDASVEELEYRYEEDIVAGLWAFAEERGHLPTPDHDHLSSMEIWNEIDRIKLWLDSGVVWMRDEDVLDDEDDEAKAPAAAAVSGDELDAYAAYADAFDQDGRTKRVRRLHDGRAA